MVRELLGMFSCMEPSLPDTQALPPVGLVFTTADNSTRFAPPLTLELQRIDRDSPKSLLYPLSYGRIFTLKQSGKLDIAF